MKVCISIPVHEQPDVIVDQINNINHFYDDDVMIVLHVSKNFIQPNNLVPGRDYDFRTKKNVFINPENLPTSYPDSLAHVHNSNFKFANKIADFDYFVLHSSNDMYVRKGAASYIQSAQNGHQNVPIRVNDDDWMFAPKVTADKELKNMMNYLGLHEIYHSMPEGTFYQKDIFVEMVKIINKFFVYGRGEVFPREEVFYPTIASKLTEKCYPPFVFSELMTGKSLTSRQITKFSKNAGLEKIKGTEHYDRNHIYAVKRIPRIYDHPHRTLIRNLLT